jgi:hypothetical protein
MGRFEVGKVRSHRFSTRGERCGLGGDHRGEALSIGWSSLVMLG